MPAPVYTGLMSGPGLLKWPDGTGTFSMNASQHLAQENKASSLLWEVANVLVIFPKE